MWPRSQTLQQRLFLVLLCCMTGIVIVVSLLFYNRTTEQLQRKITDLSQRNVSQTIGLFDLLDKGFDSLSKSISNNFDLVRLLQASPTEPRERFANERAITNIIGTNYFSRDDMIGIHIITDRGPVYNYGNYINEMVPGYRSADWYRSIVEEGGKIVWLGIYPSSIVDQNEHRPVLAFGRQLFDLDEHRPIGVVLYESSPAPIVAALANLKLSPSSEVYLIDEGGRLVSSTGGARQLPAIAEGPRPETAGESLVTEKDGKLVVSSRLPFAEWTAITVTPARDLKVELVEMQRYLIIVGVVLVLLSIVAASVLSNMISSPMRRLIREMKRVELGNFQGVIESGSYREMDAMASSFNRMVRQIGRLVDRVRQSAAGEKNAELLALQSQVNPHFLYNTLDMIYWMLDEREEDDLGEVVLALSRMFRYSSHWEQGAPVTLREELEQIRDYLTIITIRLEGRVSVGIDIPEEWLDVPMPKMILQPVIENAVKHGLEPLSGDGRLELTAEAREGRLLLTVRDNGVGMPEETLARLRASFEAAPQVKIQQGAERRQGGIGLANVHRRLRHTFGAGYGLQADREPDGGTVIRLTLPIPPLAGRTQAQAEPAPAADSQKGEETQQS
ncbi:cache domain-containing sensor histidine kinase [Paenibacillus sp. B01]|uniref:cache domain-containing sensor histidine kinase n=1 Tax=Paenibacillus sp. B01 TaxID=2660554 RepID=UPI00129A5538|nr:sensor histidine kinase [Paenibacillus sp. B01]QGG54554.1 HAMP domain-containing protein [Paenibacillus sp. B01]